MAGYELGTAEMAGSEIRMVGWAWYEVQRWLAPSETAMRGGGGAGAQRSFLHFNNSEKKGGRIAWPKSTSY
jgi:hypothetical protein